MTEPRKIAIGSLSREDGGWLDGGWSREYGGAGRARCMLGWRRQRFLSLGKWRGQVLVLVILGPHWEDMRAEKKEAGVWWWGWVAWSVTTQ